MRGCLWRCWKAIKTFITIEDATKYYGKERLTDVKMLGEELENTEQFSHPLKIQKAQWKITFH